MPDLALLALWYPVFLFSLTFHEAAHAWAAKKGGDLTAYRGGQVSLNPLPHVQRDLFGTVIVPLLTFVYAGWMMGWASTPYDVLWARRHPRRAAWMSLAGPAANFALVLCAGGVMYAGVALGWFVPAPAPSFSAVVVASGALAPLATAASILFTLNLILGMFNLFPVPPLDGAGAIGLLLPENLASKWQELTLQPAFSWVGIIIAWQVFARLFAPIYGGVMASFYALLGAY